MLKQRIITALLLTPLVIWAILALPDNYFNLMLVIFVAAASWEWALLAGLTTASKRIVFAIVISGLWIIGATVYHPDQNQLLVILWIMMVWWVVRIYQIIRYRGAQVTQNQFHPVMAITALVVIAAPFYLVQLLRNNQDLPGYLLYILLVIWAADIFAYFAGKKWGKIKLAPHVSPGKSWQGVYGAMISGVIATAIGAYVFELNLNYALLLLLLTFVAIIFSIIGDLSESLYKRELNIKDSGQLLPGHGGVLDRIDSLTAAIPVFMLGMHYMGMLR